MGDIVRSTAHLSPDGLYRYTLTRHWDGRPMIVFCMLNPSTADAARDDPTIRRVMAFARREGCGGVKVVNLFALRATDPAALKEAENPFGINNDRVIKSAARYVITANRYGHNQVRFVAAWGTGGSLYNASGRTLEAIEKLRRGGLQVFCLGITGEGFPRHPLYVPADQPLELLPKR